MNQPPQQPRPHVAGQHAPPPAPLTTPGFPAPGPQPTDPGQPFPVDAQTQQGVELDPQAPAPVHREPAPYSRNQPSAPQGGMPHRNAGSRPNAAPLPPRAQAQPAQSNPLPPRSSQSMDSSPVITLSPPPKIPAKEIQLPSQGRYYGGGIPDGRIGIRKMSANDDTTLMSAGLTIQERIDAIITRTAVLPNGFKHDDLLVTDRLMIMFAVRIFTFGPFFTYGFKCAYCDKLNSNIRANLVEELNTKYPATDAQEPFSVMLPDAGVAVTMRFLRGHDEADIIFQLKEAEKRQNRAKNPQQSVGIDTEGSDIYKLSHQVLTIDGADPGGPAVKERWLRLLESALDLRTMTNRSDELESGLDRTVSPECKYCHTPNEQILPVNSEFLRPTRF